MEGGHPRPRLVFADRQRQERLPHHRHHRRQGQAAANRRRLFERLRRRTPETGPKRQGAAGSPATRATSNSPTKSHCIIGSIRSISIPGKINWKREFYAGHPPGGRHRKNSFCSETPITDGKRVYVYITNLGLFAYDFDGKKVWNTPLENSPTILDFGTASSPAQLGDLVIIVNDNEKQQFIAAFDKNTGKQVWRTNRTIHVAGSDRQTGWSTPYIWKNEKRTEIVTIGPGLAISYDGDGKELWRIGGMSAMTIPSPFAYDGLLYLNGGTGKVIAAIKPGASGDLTTPDGAKLNDFVAWLQPKAGTYLPTELAYEGGIYVLTHTGILTRFDAKTGAQTYKARIGTGGDFTASPWGYNGKIFCLSEEGKTYVIAAGDKFELLHSNDLDEMALATPALVGDRLLLRTENRLYSIRKKS